MGSLTGRAGLRAYLHAYPLDDYIADTRALEAEVEALEHELDLRKQIIESRWQDTETLAALRDSLPTEEAEFDAADDDDEYADDADEEDLDDESADETVGDVADQGAGGFDGRVVVPMPQLGLAHRRGDVPVRDQILSLFRQQPDRAWAPHDIIGQLGRVNPDYVRAVMRKMAGTGELAQPRRGVYQAPTRRRRMNG